MLAERSTCRRKAEYFGERPDVSPYAKPQRHLAVGFWDGVAQTEPRAVTMSISPGHGELLDLPITTFDGWASALLCENVPGGDLEVLMTQKESDDPEAYRRLVLACADGAELAVATSGSSSTGGRVNLPALTARTAYTILRCCRGSSAAFRCPAAG